MTPATAAWTAEWADGLITVSQPVEVLREVVEAFRSYGGEGKPVNLQVHVSWADDDETALRIAHEQWGAVVLGSPVGWDLALPSDFEDVAQYVRPDDMHPQVLACSDPEQHVAWLAELADIGFDEVYVHHVGQEQQGFLDVYAEKVLPALGAT